MTSLLLRPIARKVTSEAPAITRADRRAGGHIPALDGIRGLAVLLVLVFHIFQAEPAPQQTLLRIGYLSTRFGQTGVELFFVLSGFLITGILLDSKNSGRYFTNFYGRRALRIFPLYYGVLIVILLIVPRFVDYPVSAGTRISLWTFTSNLALATGRGGSTLFHFWTLAIEEQFYLVWPIVVYLLDRRALMRVCLASMVVAAILRIVLQSRGISAFLFTPCRVDTLLVGAFLALAARSPQGLANWSRHAFLVAATALTVGLALCGGVRGNGSAWVQGFKYPLIAVFYGAILVIGVTHSPTSWAGRLLTMGPLRNLGRYSYGLYVYHPILMPLVAWIVLRLSDSTPFGGLHPTIGLLSRIALICGGSYAMAWSSWHFYEKHFLRFKRYFEYDMETSTTASTARA
jgi:peptidoglycan/LPS O-acetylase OafA/YrhL